jgi:DNA-directed RNA polymerase specialized sigma24 family protein
MTGTALGDRKGPWSVQASVVSADEAITSLYAAHYRSLVRIAAFLLHDVGTAEEVVQDAFIELHGHWRRLREEVIAALRELPARQREVIVLRYYADLSEAQIADAMGISVGAVKSHASRGLAALRTTLERLS